MGARQEALAALLELAGVHLSSGNLGFPVKNDILLSDFGEEVQQVYWGSAHETEKIVR